MGRLTLERSRRAGFDNHLIKPVNPETLYKLMNGNGSSGDHHRCGDQVQASAQTPGMARRAFARGMAL
jgi:hypothetical protein